MVKPSFLLAAVILAAGIPINTVKSAPVSVQKTLTGIVTKLNGNQITYRTSSAATYAAETSNSRLARKYGATMKFEEILIGDKVEVKGAYWPDNSVNAAYIRNMSLYAHNSTFSGKITFINPPAGSFIIESKANGAQNILTDSLTAFKFNKTSATFNHLKLGATAKAKGVWERTNTVVAAKTVEASVRLLNIDFTGQINMTGPGAITVVANNVIYGVDISKAKLLNKNNKTISASLLSPGLTVKVTGKHIAESAEVAASQVKILAP